MNTQTLKHFQALDPQEVVELLSGVKARVQLILAHGTVFQGEIVRIGERHTGKFALVQLDPKGELAYVPVQSVISVVVIDVDAAAARLSKGEVVAATREEDVSSLQFKREVQESGKRLTFIAGHPVELIARTEEGLQVQGMNKAALRIMDALIETWKKLATDSRAQPMLEKLRSVHLDFADGAESKWTLETNGIRARLGLKLSLDPELSARIERDFSTIL